MSLNKHTKEYYDWLELMEAVKLKSGKDPDDCHLSAAESCYDLIDQLDLHAAMRDVRHDYDQCRSDFYGDDSEVDEEDDEQ